MSSNYKASLSRMRKTRVPGVVPTAPWCSAAGYNVSWQTREGAPYSANDLARVSAGSAQTIILLRPESAMVWPFGCVIDIVSAIFSCDLTLHPRHVYSSINVDGLYRVM